MSDSVDDEIYCSKLFLKYSYVMIFLYLQSVTVSVSMNWF